MRKTMFFAALAAAVGCNTAEAVELNWKGDIRYRYESQFKDTGDLRTLDDDHSRDRHRGRVRLGVYPWINDELSAGVQLSTGSDTEPTSRNVDLTGSFKADTVYLNEYFIDFHPMALDGDVNFLLGKREVARTLNVQKDLVWDSDLTFEGATLQYGKDGDGRQKDGLSAIAGWYALEEFNGTTSNNSREEDAYLVALQAAYQGDVSDFNYNVGAGYYDFVNYDYNANANYTAGNMTGKDFNIVELFGSFGGQVTETLPWKVYSQYAFNMAGNDDVTPNIDESERDALLVGLQLGDAKVPGQWSVSGEYVSIERDAVTYLTDSDRNGKSSVNLDGWKFSTSYHVVQNLMLTANYYNFANLNNTANATTDDRNHLLQLDAVVKF